MESVCCLQTIFQLMQIMLPYHYCNADKLIFECSIIENSKLLLPTIAALPLLMAYAGGTSIIIPKPISPYIGVEVLELGMCRSLKHFIDFFKGIYECFIILVW
jgi:hypothetical protein